MTNTPDKSELLPCPFPHEVKRGVFVEVDTVDFGFARVSCSDCGCAGPYVTLANHERATKAEKAEAIAAWNTRSRPPADQVPDTVERVARACFRVHHEMGPTEEAYCEPNWGRATAEQPSGFKTERAVWDAVARAAIAALKASGEE
jgi:hypothetical protein